MSAVPLERPPLQIVVSQRESRFDRLMVEWLSFDRSLQANLWELARIAASLTGTYGESDVEEFAREVRRSVSYIYGLAQTYQAFPENSTRVENLPFTHHKVAARYKEPGEALRASMEHKLSSRQLEQWILDREAEEKKALKRRSADKREGWGRGRTSEQWEGLEAKFREMSNEQLTFYALSICSRVARSLHLETVELILMCEDVPRQTEVRKRKLKFKGVS